MRRFIENLLATSFSNQNENFTVNKPVISPMVGFLGMISFVIVQVLILCFGKYLWNNTLVKLVPAIKSASSIWEILGLSILLKLLVN